jgi:hypothetical protein
MTIKHLYVNGDSFAFGQGIEDEPATPQNLYDFTAEKRAKTYGGVITKALGDIQYTNNALPGGSNDRTFRTTMADLVELKKTQNPEDTLVMISLTEASRTEFYISEYGNFAPFLEHCEPLKHHRAVHKMWELYYSRFDHEQEQLARLYTGLLGIQAFLKLNGFKYFITVSISTFDNMDGFNNHPLYSEIDQKHFYSSPFNQYGHMNQFKYSPCHHPKGDAHRAWGINMLATMKVRGIL